MTPLHLRVDQAKSLREAIRGLLAEAEERQRESSGTMYVGAVMQHLVGAKLELVLGRQIEHQGFAVADAPRQSPGDFVIESVVVHVTQTPTELLLAKCKANLEQGLRPLIVTSYAGAASAENLAKAQGISERVDVLEFEQLLATNLYEMCRFKEPERLVPLALLIERYNDIVRNAEADGGLLIEML